MSERASCSSGYCLHDHTIEFRRFPVDTAVSVDNSSFSSLVVFV